MNISSATITLEGDEKANSETFATYINALPETDETYYIKRGTIISWSLAEE